jgi:preprotein translocase subunit SecA
MLELVTPYLYKVIGTPSDRKLKKWHPVVGRINELEASMRAASDDDLKAVTPKLKERLANGAPLDDVLPEAFAAVREVGRRVMEMRHFDVQLLGGIVLHRGNVSEMKTGEGKTLVATLPVYLNALTGKGVHVVTVNDYLASRDADWMGKIYRFLGISVGKILSNERNSQIKREAYNSDVTYGTNNEFGFDYLRDNMKFSLEEYVQRGHHYAIVDEVDSILVDEARTPLIISGPTNQPIDRYYIVDGVVPRLQSEADYTLDEKSKSVSLTDGGVDKVEAQLGIDNLYDPHNMEILHHVSQALKAHTLFKRDRDYVVLGGKVVIVDEHTGRLMHGRRWSDGLHQAIEAKEKLTIEQESQTYATITFQNYFRMYEKLAGMTGTAETEAEEFQKIYNLDVIVIPTNKTVIRDDRNDIVYKNQSEKFDAVMEDIRAAHEKGQPILVGTTSVEKSDIVSRLLQKEGIEHEILNAKNHAREAEIIAQAGRKGRVTVSTNMAGRGTDIKLGGDPEGMSRLEIENDLFDKLATLFQLNRNQVAGSYEDPRCELVIDVLTRQLGPYVTERPELVDWPTVQKRVLGSLGSLFATAEQMKAVEELLAAVPQRAAERPAYWRDICEREKVEVLAAGGLHIVGTERHESRRIDNQLRGRSGRQGDPGSSKFFLALDDDLLRIFGTDRMMAFMEKMGMQDDEPIEHRMISRSIEGAQKKVEGHNFNIRKNLLEYDDVMNQQRRNVYALRRRALAGEDVRGIIVDAIENLVDDFLEETAGENVQPEEWDIPELRDRLKKVFGLEWAETDDGVRDIPLDELRARVIREAVAKLEQRDQEIDKELFTAAEQQVILSYTDQFWKDHLLAMDRLRDGIGLRGYGQRNPLLEYKKEGFNMFLLMASLRDEAIVSTLLLTPQEGLERLVASQGGMPVVSKAAARRLMENPAAAIGGRAVAMAQGRSPEEFEEMAAMNAQPLAIPAAQAPQRRRPKAGEEARAYALANNVGRNDPCPCGSGRKFKKCCGKEVETGADGGGESVTT